MQKFKGCESQKRFYSGDSAIVFYFIHRKKFFYQYAIFRVIL